MKAEKFNDNWKFSRVTANFTAVMAGAREDAAITVALPHDAMAYETPGPEVKNGHDLGFFPGGNYLYEKVFFAPKEWRTREVIFKFEGVFCNASVFINGDFAMFHPYGYTHFYVRANDYLAYDADNTIRVTVKNGMEPTARWYSGSGIYRNVWLLTGEKMSIAEDGLRISTPEADQELAIARIQLLVRNHSAVREKAEAEIEIWSPDRDIVARQRLPVSAYEGREYTLTARIGIDRPALWSCDHPNLYCCRVRLVSKEDGHVWDTAEAAFGIRTLQLDSRRGLRINGEPVKLRGACVHHDNGVIGAAALEQAEERRVRLLKEAGFNAIRSAHNPMSEAMLNACDRLGMLVMDELCDGWNQPKSHYDYSLNFSEWCMRDLEAMIEKDYNHPSVIIYSMGNELPEAGTGKGAELNRMLTERARALDGTRYITTAVNSLMVIMDQIGSMAGEFMQQMQRFMEENPEMAAEGAAGQKGDQTEAEAGYAILLGPLADFICSHDITSARLEEIFASMDIAGMNYMTGRFVMDHEKYPDRVILSTENFPSDIAATWDRVMGNSHVIGDMTWTGWDYIGEAGIGVTYYDGSSYIENHWPDRLAYCGDIDLIGNRRPLSFLREIVYGLRKAPYIAVQKVNHAGCHGVKAPWVLSDSVASWTWPGWEGTKAQVEVYSPSEEVELFLNGVSCGKQPCGKAVGYRTIFEVCYEPGELKAVGYTCGQADGQMSLATAGRTERLFLEADKAEIRANGSDLAYVMISLLDGEGRLNPWESMRLKAAVEGSGCLEGFGSANPQTQDNYKSGCCVTFQGHALAVIRAGMETGNIILRVSDDSGRFSEKLEIKSVRDTDEREELD